MLFDRFARAIRRRPTPPSTTAPAMPSLARLDTLRKIGHPLALHAACEADLHDDWTDTDRPLRAKERPINVRPLLPAVSVDKATDHLILWANDEALTGVFTSKEIDDLWRRANRDLGLAEIRPMFVREALAGRNLCLGKRRILTPEYAGIYQRTGVERAVLYRLPLIGERVRQVPVRAPGRPDLGPDLDRSLSGPATALTEKGNRAKETRHADAA